MWHRAVEGRVQADGASCDFDVPRSPRALDALCEQRLSTLQELVTHFLGTGDLASSLSGDRLGVSVHKSKINSRKADDGRGALAMKRQKYYNMTLDDNVRL